MAEAETMKDLNVADLVATSKAGDWHVLPVDEELARRLEDDPENTVVQAAIEEIAAGKADKDAAGAENAGGGGSGGSTQGDQTWLVQFSGPGAGHGQLWQDVGHVEVPARTKRRTIVERALVAFPEASPAKDVDGETLFRVLDGDSAAGLSVRWEVPPAPEPVLRIG